VTSPAFPCAASALLTAAFDGPARPVAEVARTRVSVHYETHDADVPVVCVCLPDAVRLPSALVTDRLPGAGDAALGGGALTVGATRWSPVRWWTPPRPVGMAPPSAARLAAVRAAGGRSWDAVDIGVTPPAATRAGLDPAALVGAGPGLTPSGDDVLAGALVAAHAVGDPRHHTWAQATRRLLAASHRTTAVSRALLHHAASGWATPELAAFVVAMCDDHDPATVASTRAALLRVGHTSGAALVAGVEHTFTTNDLEGAA
jgi:hypothetical protein